MNDQEIIALFELIAQKHLNVETLEEQKSDVLDFHEVSVWQIREALEAAFAAGQQAGEPQ
jgi:hypothetical protein